MRDDEREQVRVGEAARQIGESIGAFGRAFNEKRDDVTAKVSDFVRERPVAAIGIAFGIGYVLGGGLFSRVTTRAIGLGVKLGGMALVRELLGDISLNSPE